MSGSIAKLEEQDHRNRKEITANLTPWQKVQLSRHPDRPYTLKYIEKMCTNFIELHGDRNVKDDKAMVGGFAQLGWRNGNDHRSAKRNQYQNAAVAKFWYGQSRRIPKSTAADETGRKI